MIMSFTFIWVIVTDVYTFERIPIQEFIVHFTLDFFLKVKKVMIVTFSHIEVL